jgi:hypothetical protein
VTEESTLPTLESFAVAVTVERAEDMQDDDRITRFGHTHLWSDIRVELDARPTERDMILPFPCTVFRVTAPEVLSPVVPGTVYYELYSGMLVVAQVSDLPDVRPGESVSMLRWCRVDSGHSVPQLVSGVPAVPILIPILDASWTQGGKRFVTR